jgi:hypothetical protein
VHIPAPALSGQAQLLYLQFVKDSPPRLWCSRCPTLFAMCLYCSYCLLLSFSLFPGWWLVCPGGYADLPRAVCGSTTYRLAHLVRVFPSCLGTGVLWPGGPPGFFV